MSRMTKFAAPLAFATLALAGCESNPSGPTEAKKVELTAEQVAEIQKADRAVVDEEQGAKVVAPSRKGARR